MVFYWTTSDLPKSKHIFLNFYSILDTCFGFRETALPLSHSLSKSRRLTGVNDPMKRHIKKFVNSRAFSLLGDDSNQSQSSRFCKLTHLNDAKTQSGKLPHRILQVIWLLLTNQIAIKLVIYTQLIFVDGINSLPKSNP